MIKRCNKNGIINIIFEKWISYGDNKNEYLTSIELKNNDYYNSYIYFKEKYR